MRLYDLRARAHALVSACARARTWICVSLRACTRINGTQFLACVRLRACYCAGLIKMQNAFARKKSQNSNTLWVQKLSGCTISSSKQKVVSHVSSKYIRSIGTSLIV